MVTSSIIRKNKKFLENPTPTVSTNIEERLSKPDEILRYLSDKKWHSMMDILHNTSINSQGHLFRIIKMFEFEGKIEVGTCEHCDSPTKLYRLK